MWSLFLSTLRQGKVLSPFASSTVQLTLLGSFLDFFGAHIFPYVFPRIIFFCWVVL